MSIYRIIKYLFLFALIFCPLFFLTNTTRNPYLIQIVTLENIMAVILCLWIIENLLKNGDRKQKSNEKTKLETSPLINIKNDKAELLLWIFFGICLVSTVLSIFTHPDWRFGIIAFSVKGMKFLFLNSIVVYYTTRYLVRNEKGNFN